MPKLRYCEKRLKYVGYSPLHPLHEALGDSAKEAMDGIIALLDGLDEDNETTDVKANPHADTDVDGVVAAPVYDSPWASVALPEEESASDTNTLWPPKPPKPLPG